MADLCPKWTLIFLLFHLVSYLSVNSQRVGGVELVGGTQPSEGNIMVTSEAGGAARAICDDSFGMSEANIVCRSLGYPGALRITRLNFFGRPLTPWTPDRLTEAITLLCPSGDGSSLPDLSGCTITPNLEYCTDAEAAGVICYTGSGTKPCKESEFVCDDASLSGSGATCVGESSICDGIRDCSDGSDENPTLCEEGMMRLENDLPIKIPGNSVAGTIYVKNNRTWSTVCDDLFDKREAMVVCRNLGYGTGMSVPFSRAYFGQGTGEIGVDDLECTGSETSLTKCPELVWGTSNCAHSEDAGIFCHDGDLSVQLVDGRGRGSGRVEVRSSSLQSSASICDIAFDDLDAQVICRMAGYDGTDAVALRGSHFGRPSGEVWNILLDCIGNETNIQDCRVKVSNVTCTQRQTASVVCTRGKSVDELLSYVLPADCGEPLDASNQFITGFAKVRGGTVSSRFDVPWLASLRVRTRTGYSQQCGAVIISDLYIISAAHCFETQGKLDFIISIGDFNLNYNDRTQQDFFIDKLWMSEIFEETGFGDNDIALIKIEKKNGRGITFGGRAKPVCLPKVGEAYDNLLSCFVTGWGLTRVTDEGRIRSIIPRTIPAGFFPDDVCESTYGTRRFSSSSVCFGRGGFINPCTGDSGGPLTCKDPQDRHVLYGIVSVGRDCIPGDIFPNIYTRITKYLRWIQELIYQDLRMPYSSF